MYGILDVDGPRVHPDRQCTRESAACTGSPTLWYASGTSVRELRTAIAVRVWKAFTVWRWREEVRQREELRKVA